MSKSSLKSDLEKLFKKEYSGNIFLANIAEHAEDFADAVDSYVKDLKDPADRKLQSTTKSILKSSIASGFSDTVAPNSDTAATLAATAYGTAFAAYVGVMVVDQTPLQQTTSGDITFQTPLGNISMAKVTDKGIMSYIKGEFESIFKKDNGDADADKIAEDIASSMADAIESAMKDKVQIMISGVDSTPPPPAGNGPVTFSASGGLKEN
jgi:hypothetical protein